MRDNNNDFIHCQPEQITEEQKNFVHGYLSLLQGNDQAWGKEIVPKPSPDAYGLTYLAKDYPRIKWGHLVYEHLFTDQRRLGIVPALQPAGTHTLFACLDADVTSPSPEEFTQRAAKAGVPVLVCRSRSGRTHFYSFFKEPVPMADARELCKALAHVAGLTVKGPGKNADVYPSQGELGLDPKTGEPKAGNWVYVPYCGKDKERRTAALIAKGDGVKELELEEFLVIGRSLRLTREEVGEWDRKLCQMPGGAWLTSGEPVLTEGLRNKTCYKMARLALAQGHAKGEPREWAKGQYDEWVREYIDDAREAQSETAFSSAEKYEAGDYGCRAPGGQHHDILHCLPEVCITEVKELRKKSPKSLEVEASEELKKGKGSEATRLKNFALSHIKELWYADEARPFATVQDGNSLRHYPIRNSQQKGLSSWLRNAYEKEHPVSVSTTALSQALESVRSQAYAGKQQEAYCRVAGTLIEGQEPVLYHYLADDEGTVVHLTKEGWTFCQDSPVKFVKTANMLPSPRATRGGSIEALRQFVFPASNKDFALFLSAVLMMFHPTGPFPMLSLQGAKGSGKSKASRFLVMLTDNRKNPTPREPKDVESLLTSLANRWVACLDNVKEPSREMLKVISNILTGGGEERRMLYTDDDLYSRELCRPIITTSIRAFGEDPDVLERMVVVHTKRPRQHMPESKLYALMDREAPGILGAIYDRLVLALQTFGQWPGVTGRFAEYRAFALAALPEYETLLKEAWVDLEEEHTDQALQSNPLAQALVDMFDYHWLKRNLGNIVVPRELNLVEHSKLLAQSPAVQAGEEIPFELWEPGTADQLLMDLNESQEAVLSQKDYTALKNSRNWPKVGSKLANDLKDLSPALEAAGWYAPLARLQKDEDGKARRLRTVSRGLVALFNKKADEGNPVEVSVLTPTIQVTKKGEPVAQQGEVSSRPPAVTADLMPKSRFVKQKLLVQGAIAKAREQRAEMPAQPGEKPGVGRVLTGGWGMNQGEF